MSAEQEMPGAEWPASEREERARLEAIKANLNRAVLAINSRLQRYTQDVKDQKSYLWENKAGMDHVEKVSTRQSIQQSVMVGEKLLARRNRLRRLAQSPYFGRVDFVREGHQGAEEIYIGIHHYEDEQQGKDLVFDWRAPISTIFYDHETGPVRFSSPSGVVEGVMPLKRQFRIRHGQMEFMLESSINIIDDVLQKELSRATDEGMKNIVATIQRDQNAIIRNEHAHALVIQGVAGSGKTSIALHRIAFLLYRFKDTLTSSDILIISPNRVFSDYISNVLPELGEESVGEIGMEALATELLEYKIRFQSFYEQTALLLEIHDDGVKQRIAVKSSVDFLSTLDRYIEHVENSSLSAVDLHVGGHLVPAWFIEENYKKHRGRPTTERISLLAAAIEQNIGIYYNYDITPAERNEMKAALRAMIHKVTLRTVYKNLFNWMGHPELFKPAKGSRLEYADVFPLIYMKLRLEGVSNPWKDVKHLLIDEMQDYTPVQYAVVSRLFLCRKTILGDANQSVNPYSSSTAESIASVVRNATCVKLTKSYRSSFEIMQFAQAISPNPELVAMERHGEAPRVVRCSNHAVEVTTIRQYVHEFQNSAHNSLAIICKTQKQAGKISDALQAEGVETQLLNDESRDFTRGVIVCTAHMAKGLEFDQVVVPEVNDKNYSTVMDRNLLYVACTRTMHRLMLTYTGSPSHLLPKWSEQESRANVI
jgi:DNA helicase-2/ATP-dependent DNA helicase PcrA